MHAEDVLSDALREKVAFVPGAAFFADKPRQDFMRLNYSNRSPALIDEGVARLGRAVRQRFERNVAPEDQLLSVGSSDVNPWP
jgi:2-aminoadipate transaminase